MVRGIILVFKKMKYLYWQGEFLYQTRLMQWLMIDAIKSYNYRGYNCGIKKMFGNTIWSRNSACVYKYYWKITCKGNLNLGYE